MSTVTLKPFHQHCRREYPKLDPHLRASKASFFNYSRSRLSNGGSFCKFRPRRALLIRASATETAVVETSKSSDVYFKETFPVKRTQKVEGKIFIKLDNDEDQKNWQLTVGCNLPGKWALHWGVNYVDDIGSEWDQPPVEMRPPGSIPIKDYAIETPLEKSSESEQGDSSYEVKINVQTNKNIATINFVLKDVETGAWYQHKGRNFKVLLVDSIQGDDNDLGTNNGPGPTVQLSSLLLKTDVSQSEDEEKTETTDLNKLKKSLEAFYEEQIIVREVPFDNSVTVSVRKCPETARNLLSLDTDLPGEVVAHWGVCKDDSKRWEIPTEPYPTGTTVFKNKALRTVLKQKEGGDGAGSSFILDEQYPGFIFVLKLNDNTWLNYNGSDFYVPLSSSSSLPAQPKSEEQQQIDTTDSVPPAEYTDGIIKELKKLVSGISSEKIRKTKTKEVQETILQEIEMLAAEAYSIFRGSTPAFSEIDALEAESLEPALKVYSGTGTGFEILCQGFNWESHKSGRWYMELFEKVPELSSLGFTVVWLPPPTDSVSPEGYMPRDLYNLNSRYGSVDELKVLVKKFHENGIKVLGDAVINHRCAEHKNQNGVWNIFGGRLNWDDRAVVSDDPHFQGRGNRSSGECFHAAPNIDHSQEFVRKDLTEWLCWLREEIGYDGWRLDFVRGFWGGYVKDYMEATEPYFAVGEYWDSLNYTYGEMDHNQDAHRQRIVDWINATNGTAGAFDVTTKGILHGALERCEYWRLSDEKGKPPGVLGWWPSRAITFIENHDTGSTQGHWRFPEGKVMQGYAYILTHPGTPAVFYDHIFFFHLKSEIAALIALRNRNNIHCRSPVKITKAERDVYAAVVDEKVAMKIGPGHYEPPHNQNWSLSLEGNDYKIWELK